MFVVLLSKSFICTPNNLFNHVSTYLVSVKQMQWNCQQ